ncbi:MAG TPA: YdhR family protein [Euzebyales bacterium]|nr:YdhR family protein [Euzebyales bacterium]
MNVLIVTFRLDGMSAAEYAQACEEVAPLFTAVPGLVAKVWLADPASNAYGGVYLFTNSDAVAAYLASDLFHRLADTPGLGDVTVDDFGVLERPTSLTARAINVAA